MDVVGDVRALADKGDVSGALRLLAERRDMYPRHLGLSYLMESELRAATGERESAVVPLERALAAGCRYKKEWLIANKRLAPLADLPALRDLAERAQRAYDEAAASAKPSLMFAMPDTLPDAFGYPLLMVLHGNNSNAKVTAPQWSAMADRGWVVAIPQSGEIGPTPDAFTWNDMDRAATELDMQFDRVKRATEIDTSRIVLAGFSQGATVALLLAFRKRFAVRGVIALAPWMPNSPELRSLIEGGAGKVLRTYVVIGERDASLQSARELDALLQSKGLRATLDERMSLGHDYPSDMDETLVRALAFVTK
jgi:predicted esterase